MATQSAMVDNSLGSKSRLLPVEAMQCLETRDRFMSHVHTIPETGCHWWTGAVTYRGYGKFSIKNQSYSSHRVAYALARGLDPRGLLVRHSCHNKLCCNPDHLALGTHELNMLDEQDRRETDRRAERKANS